MTQQPLFWESTPKFENIYLQRHMHPHVPCSIIHGGQDIETTKVSFLRWLGKEDGIHNIHNGILFSRKKRWNTSICDNVYGPWEYHGKQNKSDRKGQEPYDFTHMWDIKLKSTKEQTRQTKTRRHRPQCGGYQGEGWGELVKGKVGQIYLDRRRFDFGW